MPTTTATTSSSFAPLREQLQAALLPRYPDHLTRMSWDREAILAHQRARLRELLAHAREHSPFHSRRLAGIDPDSVDPTDLSALPVMTKDDLMGSFEDVLTDRRITRGLVDATLAATGTDPEPLFDEYLVFTSGGSTGRRGVFVYDRHGITEWLARFSRGLVAHINAVGGPPPGGLPMAMVAAGSAVHLSGFLSSITDGGGLPFRFVPVPVTLPVPEIVARLNALQLPMFGGYPSMVARLAGEQVAGRLQIAPAMVICSAETCSPDLRAAIRDGFGCPVLDSFNSTEGLQGAATPDGDVHAFAEDGCIVELVDADRRPVPPGTPAAAALITNLTNRVQPLIRYELTDAFGAQPPAAEHGYLRARIEGRCDDVFRYDGTLIHPLVLRSVLVKVPAIVEYQVRQTRTGVVVNAVTESAVDRDGVAGRLARALAAAGLVDPQVSVDVIPALPRDPRTGKLRRFVPLPTSAD